MLERAEETSNVCQSWVLGNEEPLYVTKVRQTNDGGWHHSNWFFVPEAAYPPNEAAEGPDAQLEGTWRCSDRGFREYLAAAAGGVFFAQSTQALDELQAFPKGSALEIPPRSVIVGSTHLLNITAGPLETAMTMEVEAVPAEEVQIRLTPFSFAIGDLAIPPAVDGVPTRSRTSMMCDLTRVVSAAPRQRHGRLQRLLRARPLPPMGQRLQSELRPRGREHADRFSTSRTRSASRSVRSSTLR